ncbi:hypothetical protein PAXINDRAFT_20050 [Paxillus involutus ATCC 200175]|uniref:G domain-containing protein n=1 Tax=Paxillus involutus ATCC 200175 TaxID=664439 RepID=A0A0C9TF19_PAXIN|nr:hypothetical protein PAXINDRAFT_20050 [Paxillus involutus ATCC 200175]
MVAARDIPSGPLNQADRSIDTALPQAGGRPPPSVPKFVAHSRSSNMVPARNITSEPLNEAGRSIDMALPRKNLEHMQFAIEVDMWLAIEEVKARPPPSAPEVAAHSGSDMVPARSIPSSEHPNQADRTIDTASPLIVEASTELSLSDDTGLAPCPPRNVLFFGETGVGKSSVINMLMGKNTDAACISSGTGGCTFASESYEVTISGKQFVLWDTVGLNESEKGKTPSLVAECNLQELMQNMEGGLSLLVYVIRGTRFREVVRLNYELFHRAICGQKVPIVAVVTGLENEERMDAWWDDNEADLRKFGLVFSSNACVTASRGKFLKKTGHHAFEDEYEDSRRKLLELIPQNCSPEPILISVQSDEETAQFQSNVGPGHRSSATTFIERDVRFNHVSRGIMWKRLLWQLLSDFFT